MAMTIQKLITTGQPLQLYSALAYDANDKYGGVKIRQLSFDPDSNKTAISIGTNNNEIVYSDTGIWAMQIRTQFSAASGDQTSNYLKSQYTYDGAGTGSIHTLISHAEVEGTLTSASGAQYIFGVHGRAIVTGAIVNGEAMVMGMKAEMLDGNASATTVSHMAALWCDYQNKDTVTGETDILYLTNNSDTTMDNAIYLYGHQVTNFVNFSAVSDQGGMVTEGSSQSSTVTCDAKIKIKIGDHTLYIPAYAGTVTLA